MAGAARSLKNACASGVGDTMDSTCSHRNGTEDDSSNARYTAPVGQLIFGKTSTAWNFGHVPCGWIDAPVPSTNALPPWRKKGTSLPRVDAMSVNA